MNLGKPQHVPVDGRKSANATLGSTQTVRCLYSGYPAPTIHWYKDGQLLIPNEGYEQKDEVENVPNSVSYKVSSELSFKGKSLLHISYVDKI